MHVIKGLKAPLDLCRVFFELGVRIQLGCEARYPCLLTPVRVNAAADLGTYLGLQREDSLGNWR